MFSASSPATRAEDTAKLEEIERMRLANEGTRDRQFNQRQNEFAQRFGRGLTGGAASTRGNAGNPANVPPGAMYTPPRAMGRTYWDQGDARSGRGNPIESQGELARAAQSWIDAGDDKKGQAAAKQALLKSYNDSPFSSITDAADIQFDKTGNMTFIKADGNPINKNPVSVDDFRRVGEANNLIDQSVFQRSGGGTAGAGGLQPVQSKSAVKAAEVVGGADIKMMGDQVKALEKQLDITNDADKPALMQKIENAKRMQREAINEAGQSIHGAGLQGAGQAQVNNPTQDMQQLIDDNKSDSEIKQIMWSKYGSDDVMKGVDNELYNRAQQPQEPAAGAGGLTQDVPIGPGGQPDLKLDKPGVGGLQPGSAFQQKYKGEQEKQAKKKVEMDTFKKVRKMYDIMSTTKNLKPDDIKYLESVYDNPNASAKVKKEAYKTYKKYKDLNP